MSELVDDANNPYTVRPTYQDTFKPRVVQQLIGEVLQEYLGDKEYNQNETGTWSREVSTAIKERLKTLALPRYKFLVQCVIGEKKGAGIRVGARCLWDAQTDKMAQETFTNDSLFCVAVAFGVYLY